MEKSASSCLAAAALLISVMIASAEAAEIQVLSSIALQTTLEDLAPQFGRANGDHVSIEFATTGGLAKRLQDGEPADVFVGTRSVIDELIKAGILQRGSDVDLARSKVGVAVRKGSMRPDISTPEALKRALLAARAISYTDPAAGGSSGIHFSEMIDRMGIASEMKAKTKYPPAGGFSARLLISGEVDLAVQQNAELLSVPGIELLGPLPAELQAVTIFAAAVPVAAREPAAARALIRYLQTPHAGTVLEAKGLEPIAQ